MEVHQVLLAAAAGDAVTNSAFEFRAVLRQFGPSEIFACHIEEAVEHEVRSVSTYGDMASARAGDNVLLYHLSIGGPEAIAFLDERPERLGIMYHNITPPRFFAPYDAPFTEGLQRGLDEMRHLRDRTSFAFAVSPFNARDLEVAGYRDVRVTPLVVDLDRLRRTTPDTALSARLDEVKEPVVLYVGQLFPHKRPDLLLATYHIVATYLCPEARLVAVGVGRLPNYLQAVHRFAAELNLPGAWLPGHVRPEELVAFYRRADAFVTMSEHEGFCLPILEAMAFDTPVVARQYAAIPETAADAALLLGPDDDPTVAAEAVTAVLSDASLRSSLIDRGRARIAAFDPHRARATFKEAIEAVV